MLKNGAKMVKNMWKYPKKYKKLEISIQIISKAPKFSKDLLIDYISSNLILEHPLNHFWEHFGAFLIFKLENWIIIIFTMDLMTILIPVLIFSSLLLSSLGTRVRLDTYSELSVTECPNKKSKPKAHRELIKIITWSLKMAIFWEKLNISVYPEY